MPDLLDLLVNPGQPANSEDAYVRHLRRQHPWRALWSDLKRMWRA